MKKAKKILIIFIYVSTFLNVAVLFFYWVQNPELSHMQIFLKFWYWQVFNIVGLLAFPRV